MHSCRRVLSALPPDCAPLCALALLCRCTRTPACTPPSCCIRHSAPSAGVPAIASVMWSGPVATKCSRRVAGAAPRSSAARASSTCGSKAYCRFLSVGAHRCVASVGPIEWCAASQGMHVRARARARTHARTAKGAPPAHQAAPSVGRVQRPRSRPTRLGSSAQSESTCTTGIARACTHAHPNTPRGRGQQQTHTNGSCGAPRQAKISARALHECCIALRKQPSAGVLRTAKTIHAIDRNQAESVLQQGRTRCNRVQCVGADRIMLQR